MKYDWLRLRNEFISGDWLSLSDFFRDKKIKNNSRTRSVVTGWKEERRKYIHQTIQKVQEKALETEIDIRLRQQNISKKLQEKGLAAINNLPVRSLEDARKVITSGLEQERAAVGIDSKHVSATQINFNYGRTNLDFKIEKMTYVELLEFIAEIKKEKESRLQRLNSDS